MNRQTIAGVATVTLLCATFGVSRAAYYAARKAPAAPAEPGAAAVVRLPPKPRWVSATVLLEAIRAVVAREAAWGVRKVWATLRRAAA